MNRETRGQRAPTRSAAPAGLVVAAFLLAGASAATVEHWQLEVSVSGDGTVRERRAVDVALDSPAALENWAYDFVLLDSNRTLETYVARIRRGDQRIDADDFSDRASLVLSGESWSSREVALRSFHRARLGDRLEVVAIVEERPYYPGTVLIVPRTSPIEQLTIEVTSDIPAGDLVWHVRPLADSENLGISSGPRGVTIRGRSLAESEQPLEIWLSWATDPSWSGVASWYRELTQGLPGLTAAPVDFRLPVGGDASALVAAAIGVVQEEVRYVAVEVGVGGYRPSPPADTWQRRWGDCKDKAALVIERLRQQGVVSYPALVRSSWTETTDPEIPSPYAFNHMIVAVPPLGEGSLTDAATPAAWSFFDPTQEFGGVDWLHPGVQGQLALVVRPQEAGGGVLLPIPRRVERESRRLQIDLLAHDPATVDRATGAVELQLSGAAAAQLLWSDDATRAGRALLESALPSFQVGRVEIAMSRDGLPRATVRARLDGPSPWNGRGSLRLPDASSFGVVEPGSMRRRSLAGAATVDWSVRLPPEAASCVPAEGAQARTENPAGSTLQQVRSEGAGTPTGGDAAGPTIHVRRSTAPGEASQEPTAEALSELAGAERRLRRSRVRLECN